MSTGTPHSEGQYPDPEVNVVRATRGPQSMNDIDAAAQGWIANRAGFIELSHLWAVASLAQPWPSFSTCANADESIREFVRAVHPPSGLHADSAKAYWDLMTEGYITSQAVVVWFFASVCNVVEELVSGIAYDLAAQWVGQRQQQSELEPVLRFVEQFGEQFYDTQDVYPEGCTSYFEAALLMAGRLDSTRSEDAVTAFQREFNAYLSYGKTEAFARHLIDLIIDIVRDMPSEEDDQPSDPDDQLTDPDASSVSSESQADPVTTTYPYRHLRRVRVRQSDVPAEEDSQATPRQPNEEHET